MLKKSQATKYLALFVLSVAISGCVAKKPNKKSAVSSTVKPAAPAKKDGIKPYKEVITGKAKSDEGLFTVHKVDDKYYYEIPDSLFGREMLAVTRYVRTPAVDGTYGGEEINEQVWKWEKRDKQVMIRVPSYINIAADSSDMHESVRNSNLAPILATFDIKALSKDSSGVVIDVTDLFSKDVSALGLSSETKTKYKVTRLDESRSYIDTIKSFPTNIEVRTMKTYIANAPPVDNSLGSITAELGTSMVLLPKVPMKPRLYDQRVGFFSKRQTDYGLDAQKATVTRYVARWRLEPKDSAAYARGELVEPKKQIVYYIDPATPKKWRPYLIEGVKDWNVAFEAAGFKNAITCLEAPTDDPDWSPEDARYSVIRYFASNIANAYGPHISDPRSGEIMESDIGWYHNVMNLVRNWFFVQTAAVNPAVRTPKFSDDVMGQLIRFVSSHEVGHTLGLAHNFGSSVAYPVDSLRSASFTQKMGGTAPSIMDYARFNYVAQPQDKGVLLYPGIGPYDKWALKWGYTYFNDKSVDEESDILNNWTVERAGDPIYFYGRQTGNPVDPRSQSEDLGDDAMKASAYGIENLKKIVPNIEKWTYEKGKPYEDLQELYGEVLSQFSRYMGHVKSNIGGIYENFKTYDQTGAVYTHVEKAKQQEALKFIVDQAFKTPKWLLTSQSIAKFDNALMIARIGRMQTGALNSILEFSRLARVIDNSAKNGNNAYAIDALFSDLQNGIFTELASGANIDVYRRNLQRAYIERLQYLLTQEQTGSNEPTKVDVSQSDIRPLARMALLDLQSEIRRALPRYGNVILKAHLTDALARIELILKPKG
ncbi:zinc-dependent metalloprotease [Pedobacter arcticus]|uniref:zinc-dependent metalloprotease n=1 Tax=Pedobacter arcticus TaxID=752140 RepID=UPI000302A977|nr:zinc-dependent metalloprotease [Pedobacter arcticus]